jgi:hypothetical protein
MSVEIRRDVLDAGLAFSVRVPRKWLEYPNDQALLTFAGDLGQPEGTLRPSVTWNVTAADVKAKAAFAGIKQNLLSLPDASLVTEVSGTGEFPHYSALVVFRNGDTGAAQTTLVHAQHIASGVGPVLVGALGNCGGAASVEVIQALSEVVHSTTVTLAAA